MAKKKKSKKIYPPFVKTPNRKCKFCKGQDGLEKTVYQTKQEAAETAHQIEIEQKLFLKAYQCPHGNGWHLAKADPGQWDDYLS
jgi:hypothetical protein